MTTPLTALPLNGKVAQPFTSFPRPDRCADLGHPGAITCPYSSTLTNTVCWCGQVWTLGDTVNWDVKSGEPMVSSEPRPDGWQYPTTRWCPVPPLPPSKLELFRATA